MSQVYPTYKIEFDNTLLTLCKEFGVFFSGRGPVDCDLYAPDMAPPNEIWSMRDVVMSRLDRLRNAHIGVGWSSYPGVCGLTTVYVLYDVWGSPVIKVVLHRCKIMSSHANPFSPDFDNFSGGGEKILFTHARRVCGRLFKDAHARTYVFFPGPSLEPELEPDAGSNSDPESEPGSCITEPEFEDNLEEVCEC